MDQSLLKRVAIQSLALMLGVITSSYALEQYKTVEISASIDQVIIADIPGKVQGVESVDKELALNLEPVATTGSVNMATSLNELKSQVSPELINQLSNNYLVIKKPSSDHITITLEDIYLKKSIRLSMTGAFKDIPDSSMVMRVRGEDYFLGEPVYNEVITQETDEELGTVKEVITKNYGLDLSHNIKFTNLQDAKNGLAGIEMLIELDSVYAHTIYEDDNYYFIDLQKPSEVYEKILVIDPGHGGKDAGALSKDEKYYEKNINLGIVLALKELLDKENIKVYYTRTNDDTVFLRPRVTLANEVDCDYFISIHCNSNEVTSPNGTEVLFFDTEINGVSNKKLAGLFSEELGKTVELSKRGVVRMNKKDIFIMEKSKVPMVLIEIGYLSNSKDLNYLIDSKNQKIVAESIFGGIMRAYNELPSTRQ